mgnify:CR=1 FL=1
MKHVSRQLKSQRARKAAGLCQTCPNPSHDYTMCDHCREVHAKKYRNAYRLKHGIPLDRPTPVGVARRFQAISTILTSVHEWVNISAYAVPSRPYIVARIEEAIRLSEMEKAKPAKNTDSASN